MPPESLRSCRVCKTRRRISDFVAVVHRVNGHRSWVCRSSVRPWCFQQVKPWERIERPGDPRNKVVVASTNPEA